MAGENYKSGAADGTDSVDSFDSMGKKKSFRRLIKRFAEKTSMQGPPYINMAKLWWAKVIWALLLLGAVFAMLLHLWYLFSQWYSWPKTTVISLGFDNLQFPQVTICNTNVLHKNRFDKFPGAKNLKMLVKDLKPENFVPHQFDDNYDPNARNQERNPQTGNEPNGNQQNGTNQDGTTKQTPNHSENTDPGGKSEQPSSTTQRSRSTRNGPTQESTTVVSRSGPIKRTTPDGAAVNGEQTQKRRTSPMPNSRQKRFVSNYETLNLSKYHENYRDFDEDDTVLTSPIDSQTKVEKIFKELYMDIDRPVRRKLGHYIGDMLVGCTFSGRQCNANFFQLHQTSEYGNCWTISSEKFIVRKSGPTGGLSIVLFLETSEYLKGLTTGYGARIQFQERDTYPFPYDEGVFVSGAMETDIGLKFRTISRLGGDFGSCNDGVEFMKLYNRTYTRRACQAFCRITSVIKICKCFNDKWEEFAFKNDESLRPCRSEKEKVCERDVIGQYGNGDMSCTCDNPCKEIDYMKSVSGRQWPTNEYARVLLDWLCDKDPDTCLKLRNEVNNIWNIKNNFLKLNIYYEDLNFENITETAQIELQQFLSDIGGAFGLWIGLSILSLCEVIQLFVELFDHGVHKAKEKQNAINESKTEKPNADPYYPESSGKGKLPRISFDPLDRLPRHLRDDSPFREQDCAYHTDTGSNDIHYKRRQGFEIFGSHSPNLRVHRESPYSGRKSPFTDLDRDSYTSEKDSDRQRHRRRSRSHEPPKRGRNNREFFENYSNFKDNFGIDKPGLFY